MEDDDQTRKSPIIIPAPPIPDLAAGETGRESPIPSPDSPESGIGKSPVNELPDSAGTGNRGPGTGNRGPAGGTPGISWSGTLGTLFRVTGVMAY